MSTTFINIKSDGTDILKTVLVKDSTLMFTNVFKSAPWWKFRYLTLAFDIWHNVLLTFPASVTQLVTTGHEIITFTCTVSAATCKNIWHCVLLAGFCLSPYDLVHWCILGLHHFQLWPVVLRTRQQSLSHLNWKYYFDTQVFFYKSD